MLNVFDFVIVGAGSAGAVLANRLSADPAINVCLIEAGPKDKSPLIKMPLGVIWLSKDAKHNWLYKSVPQTGLNGREVSIPRGKVLGGSSAINGMIYIRGHRADFDGWAAAGCGGWGYDEVLPYFRQSESNSRAEIDPAFHGTTGLLSVSDLRDPNPVDKVFIEAATKLQLHSCADFNVAEPEGMGIYQVTQQGGKRHSTAAAFLAPLQTRKNLTIVTGAEVLRLKIDGLQAKGVELRNRSITATKEVILCAGAIGSPYILLRSGIGPAAQIKSFGSPIVHDLSGVGQNLHDHVDMMMICKSRSTKPYGFSMRALPRNGIEVLRWLIAKRGMFSSNMVEAGGFVRSGASEPRPDIQFHLIPGRKSHRGRMIEYGHGISLHTCLLQPVSRGSITLNRPDGAPQIDLGLLRDEVDLERLLRGVKLARRIVSQQPLADLGLEEIIPGAAVQSDAELKDAIRKDARTVYHPVGTCAMGTGQMAVVDPKLKVHGISGLRVVDASIMPKITSGNTNAPTIMIAEKAADLIGQDWKLKLTC